MTELNAVETELRGVAVEEAKVVVIPAMNVDKETMTDISEAIREDMGMNVIVSTANFTFKKSKDKEGLESMREALNIPLPYPSVDGIVSIIDEGGLGYELLRQAIESIVKAEAREIIHSDVTLGAENFPYEKLTWAVIAAKPKAQRGGGIPKEVWELFVKDYTAVMIEHSGKTVEAVTNAATLFKNKLGTVKTNKKALTLLVGQLTIYADKTTGLEAVEAVVEFLLEKAETYMNVTDEQLLAGL